MPRYIDADKLIEMCKRQIECEWNTIAAPGSWADAFQDFSDLVEQTPTADVAPKKKYFFTEDGKPPVLIETSANSKIIEEIDNRLHNMAMEYADAGHIEYYAVCEMVYHKVIRAVEKKYTEGKK